MNQNNQLPYVDVNKEIIIIYDSKTKQWNDKTKEIEKIYENESQNRYHIKNINNFHS
ncbi:MAG: hypothetical protein ACRC4L_03740 [Mycoplasma sp.]